MSKKIKILITVLFIVCLFIASSASVQALVPCGRRVDNPDTEIDESARCTVCHFFILLERIIDFFLIGLVPPIALLMLVIGGGMFMLAAGKPEMITLARKIISSVLIGIAIIYGSYFLVGLFLRSIGLAGWTRDIYEDWWRKGVFTVDCKVYLTPSPQNGQPSGPPLPPD